MRCRYYGGAALVERSSLAEETERMAKVWPPLPNPMAENPRFRAHNSPLTPQPITNMKIFTALLLSTWICACEATSVTRRRAEGDIHACACEAEEFNFEIDCANTAAMIDSMQILKTKGCATECGEETAPDCFRHYLIVQSHHDYCPEDGVPEEVEDVSLLYYYLLLL